MTFVEMTHVESDIGAIQRIVSYNIILRRGGQYRHASKVSMATLKS